MMPLALVSGRCYQGLRWRRAYRQFTARPDDIFIVTYPKSGTTWLQMILFQLLTDGRMEELPHIRRFSPFFEVDLIEAAKPFEDLPSPRVFKTHLSLKRIYHPRARFIYVARNGMDVARSYYHHFCAYHGSREPFEAFFEAFVRTGISGQHWFRHLREAHAYREHPNVLVLHFEDLIQDLPGQIRKIQTFLNLDSVEHEMPRILERCGFAFMKRHEAKFEWAMGGLYARGMKLNRFLRKGAANGGARDLPKPLVQAYQRQCERFFDGADLGTEPTGSA